MGDVDLTAVAKSLWREHTDKSKRFRRQIIESVVREALDQLIDKWEGKKP